MGNESIKEKLLIAVKEDNEDDLIELLKNHKYEIKPDDYINDRKDFTALNVAAAFGSIKASSVLIKVLWYHITNIEWLECRYA